MTSSRLNRLTGSDGVPRSCVWSLEICVYLIECCLSDTRTSISITSSALLVHMSENKGKLSLFSGLNIGVSFFRNRAKFSLPGGGMF